MTRGQNPEMLRGEQRRPTGAGEEVEDGNFTEELDGLAQQRDHDADGGEHREGRAGEQNRMHEPLDDHAAAACPQVELRAVPGRGRRRVRRA